MVNKQLCFTNFRMRDLSKMKITNIKGNVNTNRKSAEERAKDNSKRITCKIDTSLTSVLNTTQKSNYLQKTFGDIFDFNNMWVDSFQVEPVKNFKQVILKLNKTNISDVNKYIEPFTEIMLGVIGGTGDNDWRSARFDVHKNAGSLHFNALGTRLLPEHMSSPTYAANPFFSIIKENDWSNEVSKTLQNKFRDQISNETPLLFTNVIEPAFIRYFIQRKLSVNSHQAEYLVNKMLNM